MTDSKPRDDHSSDDHGSDDERCAPAPGPTDQGGRGGMATREVAPEIAEAGSDEKSG